MKTLLVAFAALMSLSAYAHIDQGIWKGVVSPSADCFMEVGAQIFENNLPHPLNERIKIKVGSTDYLIRHPYSINATSGEVSFNHDLFEGVVATKTGAFALVIKMAHTDEFEGPVEFSVMEHNWKTGNKELVHCKELKLVSP